MPRPGRHWIPAAVLALTAAIYLPSLTFGFVYDDREQIVWSQPYLAWHAVPTYFTTDVWSYTSRVRTNYYRPIFLVWLMLNYKLFGLNTALWHLSAILLHLAATLLFYFLARRLVADPLAAGIAALVFGVHPVHVEAVAWVSGVTEALFTILAFGTILCHLRWRDGDGPRWRIASVLLFAADILSKETAVIIPVLIAAYEWLFPLPSASTGRVRRIFFILLPYAAIVPLYVAMRLHALASFAPASKPWPLSTLAATWLHALSFYLRQLLVPIRYSAFYPISAVRELGLANFWIPLLVVVTAAAVLIWIWRRSAVFAFSAVLLVAPILPALNLQVFAPNDFVHDRYLYLAVAGLSMLAALAIQGIRTDRVKALMGIAPAVILALSLITLRTSFYWRDDLTLFTRAIEVAPENSVAQACLGNTLARAKRCPEAIPMLKSALGDDPWGPAAPVLSYVIGLCYSDTGDNDQAAEYLRDAIAMQPRYAEAHLGLGFVKLRQGKLDEAEADAREALRLRMRPDATPEFDRYHFILAAILDRKGDLPGALAEYQAELAENPQADDVRDHILDVKARLGGRR